MKTNHLLSLPPLLVALCLTASTCGPKPSGPQKRYELKGKIIEVNKVERTATIEHEEIKDYMPAMTMPFFVKDDVELNIIKPGDTISTTLVVEGKSSWIEQSTISEGVPPDVQSMDVPGEPKRGEEIPDFHLTNQDGKPIRLAQYRGKTLVLTFIYTRCPQADQCPLMSENFHQIDQELQKDQAFYARTHLLSITFDPEYDTPKVLRSYGAALTGRYSDETFQQWEFATGTEEQVKGVAQFFGLRYFHDTDSGRDQVIHTLRTAVIGPDGKLIKIYRENKWKPEDIVADLRQVPAN